MRLVIVVLVSLFLAAQVAAPPTRSAHCDEPNPDAHVCR